MAPGKLLDTTETNEHFIKTDIVNPAARTILAASRYAHPKGSARENVIIGAQSLLSFRGKNKNV